MRRRGRKVRYGRRKGRRTRRNCGICKYRRNPGKKIFGLKLWQLALIGGAAYWISKKGL